MWFVCFVTRYDSICRTNIEIQSISVKKNKKKTFSCAKSPPENGFPEHPSAGKKMYGNIPHETKIPVETLAVQQESFELLYILYIICSALKEVTAWYLYNNEPFAVQNGQEVLIFAYL